jgi:hypothetical protein
MASSLARLEANRRNARKSTGPKTESGKMASRCNALKHGLTGEGVVLAGDEAAEVDRRAEAYAAELAPRGELARMLVRRVAQLSVRMERSARAERAAVAFAARHAEADHAEARAAEVSELADRLAEDPETSARRLRATPEGIAWLAGRWEALRDAIRDDRDDRWNSRLARHADNLTGRRRDAIGLSRIRALSNAIDGNLNALRPEDGAGLDIPGRRAWARAALDALIGEQLEGLARDLAALRPEVSAADRAEAADRSAFDPATPAVLARRYEAAAERGLFLALDRIDRLAAAAETEGRPAPAPEPAPEPIAQPAPEPVAVAVAVAPEPAPTPAPPAEVGSFGAGSPPAEFAAAAPDPDAMDRPVSTVPAASPACELGSFGAGPRPALSGSPCG